MNAFLTSLQETALSEWVLGSIRGYPIVLSFHSLGLGLLVGLLTIIALRILGFMSQQPLAPMRKLLPWVWVGFAVNLTSGLILFMADAVKDFHSWTFWIKMSCIAIGMAFAVHINNVLQRPVTQNGPSRNTRIFAAISLAAWLGATVAGRLIAYLVYESGSVPA